MDWAIVEIAREDHIEIKGGRKTKKSMKVPQYVCILETDFWEIQRLCETDEISEVTAVEEIQKILNRYPMFKKKKR